MKAKMAHIDRCRAPLRVTPAQPSKHLDGPHPHRGHAHTSLIVAPAPTHEQMQIALDAAAGNMESLHSMKAEQYYTAVFPLSSNTIHDC
jgi:hypothetical protein